MLKRARLNNLNTALLKPAVNSNPYLNSKLRLKPTAAVKNNTIRLTQANINLGGMVETELGQELTS